MSPGTNIPVSGGSPFSGQTSAEEADLYPLSFGQQGLWFLDQLEPGRSTYNLAQVWRLNGPLNHSALEQAWNEIVQRQESLRTTFGAVNGRPVQLVTPSAPVKVPTLDLCDRPDRDEHSRRLINDEVNRPFDLRNGPLYRVQLLKIDQDEHLLILILHHIISDGESFHILRQEMETSYQAFCNGGEAGLPSLPIQYLDYAHWHREWLRGERWNKGLAYWSRKLSGASVSLDLPFDHPRPVHPTQRGAAQAFDLPADLVQQLKELCRQEEVTLFMLLLAALKVFLHRCTGQEDIVVGTPVSGRSRGELEGLVGYFINTLVLRTDVGGDPTFVELLRRVRETTVGALAHQEIPFDELVKASRPQRGPDQNGLVQVVLGLQMGYPQEWNMGNLRATLLEVETQTAKFDWTFLLEETGCGIRGRLEYNTDLFEADTIVRFLRHLHTLLQGIAANPRQRISELPLLTPGEQHQLLVEWNGTTTAYERGRCIHELFEEQVVRSPDAVALVQGDRRITYRELNDNANRLAHRLRRFCVGAERLVGLCLERSIEMITAMLAILKAGGAYVPLDRTYPRERLEFMLSDAGLSVLVTDSAFVAAGPDINVPRVVCLDHEHGLEAESAENPQVGVVAESPAYVIYTSGSTGTPKGTVIPHRGVVRLVRHTNYVRISTADVFLQLAPISFDASTFEVWGSLLNGSRLVIYPPHIPSLEELGRTIQQHRVTILWLTAGLFHQMVDYQLENLKGVKQLLAGGDVLSVPHVLKVLRELDGCSLINGYGPTENTTFTCCYQIPADWSGEQSVPIGGPISNTQVGVLDKHLSPVPIGMPGELVIGGDGLARCYLNRPELTAEKFVRNPFHSGITGDRIYRTGDSVRWLADGNIEFIGRKDRQVKIRGFRVELSEIEAAIVFHPLVREAAVVLSKAPPVDRRILAYVIWNSIEPGQAAVLRKFLESRLPSYMLPSNLIELPELPLTPNGKVDYQALPAPEARESSANVAPVPPGNPTETTLSEIWNEVLGGQVHFGVHDNFFQLGGHSLLATQMISRIARTFGIELPVRAVFESPTIALLAGKISCLPPNSCSRDGIVSRRVQAAQARELLRRLDELSETEVELLLSASESKQTP